MHKRYPKNSILGLIDKKVYSEDGDYLGEVKDVIFGENRIDGLKVQVNKRHKLGKKGIIVSYRYVKSVGKILVFDKRVLEKIQNPSFY